MGEQRAHGWRVSRHRLVADAAIGVIANPMSGRDIRRLVASAFVFPNAEKASMVVRLTAAAGELGVRRVLVSTDTFGVSAAVQPEPFTQVGAGICSPRRRTGLRPRGPHRRELFGPTRSRARHVVGIEATGPNSSSRSVSTPTPLIASAPSAPATARSVNTRPGA